MSQRSSNGLQLLLSFYCVTYCYCCLRAVLWVSRPGSSRSERTGTDANMKQFTQIRSEKVLKLPLASSLKVEDKNQKHQCCSQARVKTSSLKVFLFYDTKAQLLTVKLEVWEWCWLCSLASCKRPHTFIHCHGSSLLLILDPPVLPDLQNAAILGLRKH